MIHEEQGDAPHPFAEPSAPVVLEGLSLRQVMQMIHRGIDAWVNQEQHHRPVWVTATPLPKLGKGGFMGNWQFLQLSHGGIVVEGRMEKGMSMPWNAETGLLVSLGVVEWSGSRVLPQLTVLQVGRPTGQVVESRDERLGKWDTAIQRTKKDVSLVLQKDRPRVVVVTSDGGEAWSDVTEPLREFTSLVTLQRVGARMTDPQSVRHALEAFQEQNPIPDLVILTRGGGEGIDVLDDDQILEVASQSAYPLVVAIGHTRDRLVLDLIADKSCATPRECGLWLRGELERKRLKQLDIAHAKEQQALKQLPELKAQLSIREADLIRLNHAMKVLENRNRLLFFVTSALAVLAAIMWLLR